MQPAKLSTQLSHESQAWRGSRSGALKLPGAEPPPETLNDEAVFGDDQEGVSRPLSRRLADSRIRGGGDDGEGSVTVATTTLAAPPRLPFNVASLLFSTALVQSFSAGCISLYINLDLAFGPVEVTRYWMYIGLTVWLQPLLGWLSDALVLCGERRRPLFVLSAIGSAAIFSLYVLLPGSTGSYHVFVVLSALNQLFTMGQYIPLNGLMVEVGTNDAETTEQSTTRMSGIMSQAMTIRSVGSLASSVLQMTFLLLLSVRALVAITACFYVLLAVNAFLAEHSLFVHGVVDTATAADSAEEKSNACKRAEQTYKRVRDSFNIRDVRSDGFSFVLVLLFVFLYTLMPDGGSVYYNYLYAVFQFPTWFYSLNGLIGSIGSTLGAYAFSLWMGRRARLEALGHRSARTSVFFLFVIGSITWALAYLTNLMLCTGFVTNVLRIPAGIFVPVDTFFVALCVRFAFMPTIIMAAEHAPKNFEASAFEVFSVASIGGGTLSSLLTSFIAQWMHISRTDFGNLWLLLLLSMLCKLVPIPVAYGLPEQRKSQMGDAGATVEEFGVVVVADDKEDRGDTKGTQPVGDVSRRTCEREDTRVTADVADSERLPNDDDIVLARLPHAR